MTEQEEPQIPFIDPSSRSKVTIHIAGENVVLEIEERQRRILPYISFATALLDDVRNDPSLVENTDKTAIVLSPDLRRLYLRWNLTSTVQSHFYSLIEDESAVRARLSTVLHQVGIAKGEYTAIYDEEYDQTHIDIMDFDEVLVKVAGARTLRAEGLLSAPEPLINDIHAALKRPKHVINRALIHSFEVPIRVTLEEDRISITDKSGPGPV